MTEQLKGLYVPEDTVAAVSAGEKLKEAFSEVTVSTDEISSYWIIMITMIKLIRLIIPRCWWRPLKWGSEPPLSTSPGSLLRWSIMVGQSSWYIDISIFADVFFLHRQKMHHNWLIVQQTCFKQLYLTECCLFQDCPSTPRTLGLTSMSGRKDLFFQF